MAIAGDRQEFSRLELNKAAFDLSDRGVEGRNQPGPVDAFLYTSAASTGRARRCS
jgi:uncharacterized protein YfaS (alpha-2-macroglobulin family)